jgi:hypothetical protein
MTDAPVQPAPAGAGTAPKREPPIFEEAQLGPWRGRVRVIPIVGVASRWGTTQFEVSAEWHGPGLVGLPPTDRPVDAADTYMTDDVELALVIARRAVELLRRGDVSNVPDLRALACRKP